MLRVGVDTVEEEGREGVLTQSSLLAAKARITSFLCAGTPGLAKQLVFNTYHHTHYHSETSSEVIFHSKLFRSLNTAKF